MTIEKLNEEIKNNPAKTHEERMRLLKDAEILDENGDFHSKWFSEETIRKDKERRNV